MSFRMYTENPKPSGFINKNSICWLNSILQLLLSLPALNDQIDEIVNGATRGTFLKLMNKLFNEPDKAEHIVNIHKYFAKQPFKSKSTQLVIGQQECVVQAFDFIIDNFKNELVQKLFTTVYQMMFRCKNCHKEITVMRDISTWINILQTDKQKIVDEESFQAYALNRISVLDEFKCNLCGADLKNITYVDRLKRVNEILIFNLDRFNDKTQDTVYYFPEKFFIPYSRDGKRGRLWYKLVAKIEHSGSLNGGHYYTHCLRSFVTNNKTYEKWYCIDDSYISEGTPEPSKNTFMIAYHCDNLEYI